MVVWCQNLQGRVETTRTSQFGWDSASDWDAEVLSSVVIMVKRGMGGPEHKHSHFFHWKGVNSIEIIRILIVNKLRTN